jgi:hypothetical protein
MSSAPLQKSVVPERLIEYFVTVGIGSADGQIKAIKDKGKLKEEVVQKYQKNISFKLSHVRRPNTRISNSIK